MTLFLPIDIFIYLNEQNHMKRVGRYFVHCLEQIKEHLRLSQDKHSFLFFRT